MRIRVGCEFQYDSAVPTPTVWQVRPRAEPAQRLASESWGTSPSLSWSSYHDAYGNVCDRLTLPPGDQAWNLFGGTEPGWPRVAAVCDWVHENVQFQVASSGPLTSALDVWECRTGVCRDFSHLGLTLCRSLNIPARYVFGYMPDVGVPVVEPMDFCAWFEAYLEDRWWTFDPRNNIPRIGRVVIGRGRDALDVAMVTTYGAPILKRMTVWADEIGDQAP
jgi:transglutaminase-like putative cysteine protease